MGATHATRQSALLMLKCAAGCPARAEAGSKSNRTGVRMVTVDASPRYRATHLRSAAAKPILVDHDRARNVGEPMADDQPRRDLVTNLQEGTVPESRGVLTGSEPRKILGHVRWASRDQVP